MAKLLRQLAFLNLAAAVAFLLPVIFWAVAENLTRGTLAFKLEPGETAEQALAKIQAATDIETLRYRASLLTKMRQSDKRTRQLDANSCGRTLRATLAWTSLSCAASVTAAGFI